MKEFPYFASFVVSAIMYRKTIKGREKLALGSRTFMKMNNLKVSHVLIKVSRR
jgi:hypothetical protein